ncbi:MAG TPA: MBL fold metallo-hydrolase, partial [Methylococcales bacterium]
MKIKFYGNTCFSIGDSSVTLVTDPNETVSSLKANAVTVSQRDPEHNNISAIQGEPKILDWPGEYEVSGVHMQGIASFHNAKEDKD